MKETGIIMSGDHPKLILDGIKTMTRRTWGLEEINKDPDAWFGVPENIEGALWRFFNKNGTTLIIKCPYGGVGDILIMRETWASENRYNNLKPSEIPDIAKIFYLASEIYDPFKMGIVRPSLFLPYKFSRGKLEITEIRAERLTEISADDIRAEGLVSIDPYRLHRAFRDLWDSLNAKRGYGWDRNNWVFPISIRRIEL